MRASIIITGDKKENFLKDTIESCLKQNCRDFEIILVYNKLHNFKHLKEIFKNKIIFKKIKKKIKNPVRDQLYKIYEGLKTAKGKYIFLLDGDDIFKKNKLISILNIKKKNCLFLDDHLILKRGKYIYKNNKFYKKYLIYKLLFNSWPDKICTSCISGQKELFTKFYESIKIELEMTNNEKTSTKVFVLQFINEIRYKDLYFKRCNSMSKAWYKYQSQGIRCRMRITNFPIQLTKKQEKYFYQDVK